MLSIAACLVMAVPVSFAQAAVSAGAAALPAAPADAAESPLVAALRPSEALELPDAPGLSGTAGESSSGLGGGGQVDKTTPVPETLPPTHPPRSEATDMTIAPGQIAPPQTVRDKMIGGVKDSVSLFSLTGEVISAGYSHVTNGSPNFGTDAPAFGERAGASFARGTSQNIFSESVMASVLHEDARYYELGSQFGFMHRLFYAGTRPLLTRTDNGSTTPNFALLSGYLGAAYLTKAYYPVLNQSNVEVFKTYGNSLGGAALGYVVTEFLPGILTPLHLKSARHD